MTVASSTLRRLRADVREAKRPFALFVRTHGPKNLETKTYKRWRQAQQLGLVVLEPFLNGVMVRLTNQGKGYFKGDT